MAEDKRPRPAYGELAPEGWEWKPEEAGDSSGPEQGESPGSQSTGAGATRAARGSDGSAPVPGVPHNLGTGTATPVAGAQSPTTGSDSTSTSTSTSNKTRSDSEPAPYRPSEPQPYRGEAAPQYASAAHTGTAKRPARVGDRVITILLLVLGAFGALNTASSFFSLKQTLVMVSSMIGVDSPTIAGWVTPLGTTSGVVALALYAVTIIYSIQRMRANKLTFWVPLVAGVVAFILVMVVQLIAMYGGAPEMMQQLQNDPNGSMDQMMEYLQGATQP